MRPQISFLTQSRFYSPAFNAAIFDGPLRIYFAQFQEPQALKIYFTAQQRLQGIYAKIRDNFRRNGTNIFVMLYPSTESFDISFDGSENLQSEHMQTEMVRTERLGVDYVVGVKGPINDGDIEKIYERVEMIARSLADDIDVIAAVPEHEPIAAL